MIAWFPMYDWPEVQTAYDAFWNAIRSRLEQKGIEAPKHLSRENGSWLAPDLLLGQTCGYPFATSLKDKVRYVATPVYRVTGCEGPTYSSAIVVNRDSDLTLDRLKGTKFAFNSVTSLSGFLVMRAMVGEPEHYFSALVEAGGHRQSARCVANGGADVAAIDAVCWHLLRRHEAVTTEALRIIGWTEKRPNLPLITALKTSDDVLAKLREAIVDVTEAKECKDVCQALTIGGFEIIDVSRYAALSSL